MTESAPLHRGAARLRVAIGELSPDTAVSLMAARRVDGCWRYTVAAKGPDGKIVVAFAWESELKPAE